MKFTCKKEEISKILSLCQNVVSSKSTMSILSNVLLETEGKKTLYITGTDLEIGTKFKISAEIIEEGSITLPAKKLYDVIKDFPIRNITIDISDKHIASISSPNSIAKIVGMAKDEFPSFPEIKSEKAVTLEQKKLKKMLNRTSYSISHDTTRYVLTGALMSFQEEVLTMVATDGKRLAITTHPLELTKESKEEIIVPAKTINELSRILKDEGEVTIQIIDNQVAFSMENVIIVSRLIEGHFPDYRQVIPENTKHTIQLNREEFSGAISRAAIFTDQKSNSIKLTFKDNKLTISANISEIGEIKEEIDIAYKDEEISIAFNPAYILDALKTIENAEIDLELSDNESPGIIKTTENFTYIIMPMRIS